MANRVLRIFPVFIACLLFAWAILFLLGRDTIDPGVPPAISIAGLGWSDFVLGASILGSAVSHEVFKPNPPSWTIYVELVFYLLVALALFLRESGVPAALAIIGVASAILFFAPPFSMAMGFFTIQNVTGAFKHSAFFLLGASLFFVQFTNWGKTASVFFAGSLLLAGGAIFGMQHAFTFPELFVADSSTWPNLLGMTLLLTMLAYLSSAPVSTWFSRQSPWLRQLDARLGDLTYPFYLCHVPVLALLWLDPTQPRNVTAWLVSLVACLAVAILLHMLLESRLRGLRNRLRRKDL